MFYCGAGLVVSVWGVALFFLISARLPSTRLSSVEANMYQKCLAEMPKNEFNNLVTELPKISDLRITKTSDTIFEISFSDSWNSRTWFFQTLSLRRFARFIRNSNTPVIIFWKAKSGYLSRRLGSFLFQARLQVSALGGDSIILARNPDTVKETLHSFCSCPVAAICEYASIPIPDKN